MNYIKELIKEIVPESIPRNWKGFNVEQTIDSLSKKEKNKVERVLVQKLKKEEDWQIVEVLIYMKASNVLPILMQNLNSSKEPYDKIVWANAIYRLNNGEEEMKKIALCEFEKITDEYSLRNSFYPLAEFHDPKINARIANYQNDKNYLNALHARTSLGIDTKEIDERKSAKNQQSKIQNTTWRKRKEKSSLPLGDIINWVANKIWIYYDDENLREFYEDVEVIVGNDITNKKLRKILRRIDDVQDCQKRLNEIIESAYLKYESHLKQFRDGLHNNSKYESKIIREYELLEELISKLEITRIKEIQRGIHPYVNRKTLEEIDLSVFTRIESLKLEELFNTKLLLFLVYSKIKSLLIAEAALFNFKLTNRRIKSQRKRKKKLTTFGIEKSQYSIIKNILIELHDEIELFETKKDRNVCIKILQSSNFEEIKQTPKVQLRAFHYKTKYIVDQLKPLFSNFNCSTFGESGFFYGSNGNSIDENSLNSSYNKAMKKRPFKKFKKKVDPIFFKYLKK